MSAEQAVALAPVGPVEAWDEWVGVARELRAAVEAALRRRNLGPRARERLEMVKGVALGQSLAEVARWSGRSARTVRRWLGAFARGGLGEGGVGAALAAVADAPRAGRPVRADAAYLAALERAVATPPRDLGLLFDVWTSDRLSAYLAETTGVRIAPGWVRALLARQRYRTGRPKHTLGHLQDAAARTAGEQELEAVEKKGAGGRGRVRAALPG
ncbi:MAG: helix-turn-helix domain-containing protein [Chloroflexi bacterium]|nr:helix-turn-helix domain-containing protein [Chloroflexota bacterium]